MKVQIVKKSTQDQFNVNHATVLGLLSEAGVPANTKLGLKKRGNCLKLTTANGTEIIMGDTHAIWKSHQKDDRVVALFNQQVGAAINLDIAKVEYLENVGLEATPVTEVEVDL